MKLQIVVPTQPSIENFERVEIHPNSMDLSRVSDNECTLILANDAIDYFSVDKIGDLIQSLIKKVRMGGEIVIGGTDVRLFAKMIINDQLDELQACQMIGSIQSLSNMGLVLQVFQQGNFEILSTQISGIHYEIKAKRA